MASRGPRRVGNYEIGRVLGRGTFGDVHECLHTPSSTRMVVKVIDRRDMVDPALGARLRREIAIMKLLQHPNVVSAKHVFKDSNSIYIMMELVSGGELFNEITKNGKLSEDVARKYTSQLIDGLSYCHKAGIVHRNLKAENLLLDKDKNLKITDFGVANFLTIGVASGPALMQTKVGSHDYVAPEVLTQKEGYRGQPADVWSCGVILYAMLAGMLPFDAENTRGIFRKICSADFVCPDWFSDEAADLLHKMLVVNPDKRIKIEDICAEPWFKGTKMKQHAKVDVNDSHVDGALVQVEDAAAASAAPKSKGAPKKRAPKPKKERSGVRGKMRDYLIMGMLGKGAFSQVFQCVHVPTDREFAMKVMSRSLLQKKQMSSGVEREIAIMKTLDHPNVVVMREALGSSVELFLVLDLVAGGSVREALEKKVPGKKPMGLKFEESRAKRYVHQLFSGLAYCHSAGVCHRDLKPDNLMLDENDNLKIADFGLGNFSGQMLFTRCGTPHYVAPEIIDQKGPEGYDGKIADIWSCGVIVYRMLAGRVPFKEDSTTMLYNRIRSADYWMPDWFSDEAQDILQRLLVPKPSKRVTLEDAKKDPWFAELNKDKGAAAASSSASQESLAPSDWSIATAIKPVLRSNTFRMGAFKPAEPATESAAAASPSRGAAAAPSPPMGAAAAAATAAGALLVIEKVKIDCKKHKIGLYKSLYKSATVTLDANKLNVVVGNEEIRTPPFPMLFNGDFEVSNKQTTMVIKLPRKVLPKPKYYKFTWNASSPEAKDTAKRISERMAQVAAPSLEGATPKV